MIKNASARILLSLCLSLLPCIYLQAQEGRDTLYFHVVSYNVENLFDCRHDSLKNDYEFLPDALRHWTWGRYYRKLDNIARALIAAGEGEPPALVGLCEVENDRVMQDLTRRSALQAAGYRYLMTDSPDPRGIDVALLYQPGRFKPITHESLTVPPPSKERHPTRDILHVSGLLLNRDTLDVFVCHLPSRAGGAKASSPYRIAAARRLKAATDSLFHLRRRAQIIIMGDFNDYPANASIQTLLQDDTQTPPQADDTHTLPQADATRTPLQDHATHSTRLHHLLASKTIGKHRVGSYKYQGEWGLLDHLIVSETLLEKDAPLYTDDTWADVFHAPFLLIEDKKYGGRQPFRTYNGMKYQPGFSDHLPVRTRFRLIY